MRKRERMRAVKKLDRAMEALEEAEVMFEVGDARATAEAIARATARIREAAFIVADGVVEQAEKERRTR